MPHAATGNLAYVIDVMFTCALLHGSSRLAANLKMSDVSDDSYHQLNSIFCCVRSESKQEAQLMLTNPRDVFRGQSRPTNTVPLYTLGNRYSFLLVFCSNFVPKTHRFRDIRLQKYCDLESRVRDHSGHWTHHHSIERIRLPTDVLQ